MSEVMPGCTDACQGTWPGGRSFHVSRCPNDEPTPLAQATEILRADRARDQVPLTLLSQALDEIYALRQLCAYQARVRQVDLSYKTYPKSRRQIAEDQVGHLHRAAQGEAIDVTRELPSRSLRQSLTEAGAKQTLTRAAWEAEQRRGTE